MDNGKTRQTANNKKGLYTVLGQLPVGMAREIAGILNGASVTVFEIRLRAFGVSTVVTDLGNLPLCYRVTGRDIEKTVERLCRGSVYAYLDCIASGYLPLAHGVRVGIIGEAGYSEEKMVGISGASALSFRIPTAIPDLGGELYRAWQSCPNENLLLVAPPSGGKTTALRALARQIGSGRDANRVVVVDERCEFDPEDYANSSVDILRGYKRGAGTEIAVRTMSPEVLLVDEIASEADASALCAAFGVGIPIVATAHGTCREALMMREPLRRLLCDGCFTRLCRIERTGAEFKITPPEAIAV